MPAPAAGEAPTLLDQPRCTPPVPPPPRFPELRLTRSLIAKKRYFIFKVLLLASSTCRLAAAGMVPLRIKIEAQRRRGIRRRI